MKKTIAILLILVIGMVGVFAAYEATTVKITTEVVEFMHIGLTDKDTDELIDTAFDSESDFTGAVESEVIYTIEDFATLDTFEDDTLIAYVWGITNTLSGDITVNISTAGFKGLTDTDTIIPLALNGDDNSTTLTIPKAEGNDLGVLKTDNTLSIKEKNEGDIALAPAQLYEATITISIGTP